MKWLTIRLAFCLGLLTACQPQSVPTATPPVQPTPSLPADSISIGGNFFAPHTLDVGENPEDVAAADLNGDGHIDLVVTYGQAFVAIFLGDGQGGLARRDALAAGAQPQSPALADLDGDGALDIVVANHDTDHLTIFLGDGAGGFVPAPNSPLAVDVAPHPHTVLAQDVDGDGWADLLVDHRDGEGVLLLRGRDDGTFETPGVLVPVGGDPYLGMALGDLNGDGRLDLVTPNPQAIGVLLGDATAEFGFRPLPSLAADDPFGVALGDVNGDGRLDITAAGGERSPLVYLFLGSDAGDFQIAEGFPLTLTRGGKKLTVGDLNGDGLADVAVANYQSPDVTLLLGGDPVTRSSAPGGEHPWGLIFADFNADGRDDLVVVDSAASTLRIYLSFTPQER